MMRLQLRSARDEVAASGAAAEVGVSAAMKGARTSLLYPGSGSGTGLPSPGSNDPQAVALSSANDLMGNSLASYFSQLFEKPPTEQSEKKKEKKKCKKCKKTTKQKDKRKIEPLVEFNAVLPEVGVPRTPSPFAVFAAIRATCMEIRQRQASYMQLQSAATWKEIEESDTSDTSPDENSLKKTHLPKIVSIGLHSVFEIIRESQVEFPQVCKKALESLLNILQGLQPEELANEPMSVMEPMFTTLLDLSTVSSESDVVHGQDIRSLACASLLSFAVALGDTSKLLSASSAILMSPSSKGSENIKMPAILVSLQRSVTSVMLSKTEHPNFMSHGIPKDANLDAFPVDFVKETPQDVHSIASDGTFIFLQTSQGLFKIGSGYGCTIKGHVYKHRSDFQSAPGWLGCVQDRLFFHLANEEEEGFEVMEVEKTTLGVKNILSWRPNESHHQISGAKRKGARYNSPLVMFSDGQSLGAVTLSTDEDSFSIKKFSISKSNTFTLDNEMPLKLARKCVESFGYSVIHNDDKHHLLDFGCEDEAVNLYAGKDFAFMLSSQGKIYFSGKLSSIGYKQAVGGSTNGPWTEITISRAPKINQVAIGHDGLHALILAEDGSVYFTGTARRGEDGDQTKNNRRQPKPIKPKRFSRLEGISVSQVACNNGSSAMVSKSGSLFLFGKDATHTDFATGKVTELAGVNVTQVAIGKAHVVALSGNGEVYTFGINNKGQCGRDFITSKEPTLSSGVTSIGPSSSSVQVSAVDGIVDDTQSDVEGDQGLFSICPQNRHNWKHDQCMVCVLCGECTGYGSSCVSSGRPDRNPGTLCGCGSGDSGCADCGICRNCAGDEQAGGGGVEGGIGPNMVEDVDVVNLDGQDGASVDVAQQIMGSDNHFDVLASFAHLQDMRMRHRARVLAAHERKNYKQKLLKRSIQKLRNGSRNRRQSDKEDREMRRPSLGGLLSDDGGQPQGSRQPDLGVNKAPEKLGLGNLASGGAASDVEKEAGKLISLPPAIVNLPKNIKITQIASGLHHSLLLSSEGEVFTFGSNSHGQLGFCDLNPRGSPSKVAIEAKIISVAAGSYHSVALSSEGEVYTFGSHQKGQLGRETPFENDASSVYSANDIAARELWYAIPGTIPNVGQKFGRNATWIGASGDQTFMKIDESLISATNIRDVSVIGINHQLILIPNNANSKEGEISSTFNCLVISRSDGFCRSFVGSDQVCFVGKLASLDPNFNVLWTYDHESRLLKTFMPPMKEFNHRFEDAASLPTIFSPELALPLIAGSSVLRNQASLNLLSCLDTLNQMPETNLVSGDDDLTKGAAGGKNLSKEDYNMVNRFDSHGGGWGYSGHSIEAIRFMVDTDVLLGGYGLFGGRGEYVGKIKLYDLGTEGGEQEGDGELLAESEEVTYECGARQKYPILFEEPIHVQAGRWYIAWARVSGPSSDCGSSGQTQVITEEQIQFNFKSSKKSNNGTDVNAGQLPQLLYKVITLESKTNNRYTDPVEPVCILTNKFARSISSECFEPLFSLIEWSWNAFKVGLRELLNEKSDQNGLKALTLDLERFVFIMRACLRLLVNFTNEVYPVRVVSSQSKPVPETPKLAEAMYTCKNLLQRILKDPLSALEKAISSCDDALITQIRICQKMCNIVLLDAHRSFVSCFHAFYPTGYLKWAALCNLLALLETSQEGDDEASGSIGESRENIDRMLAAVLDALCQPMIKLRNTFPITYSPEADTRCRNLSPLENLSITASMIQAGDNSQQRFPILTELMNYQSHVDGIRFASWSFREVLDRLLAIVSAPVKQALKGEPICFSRELEEKSCQVISAVIAELTTNSVDIEGDMQRLGGRILHITPNRFARASSTRTWNTGNGSPDAICFSVDRSGIFIVGCSVYGGMGTYEYELEMLDDQNSANEKDPNRQSQRWNSLEITHGSYSSDDCVNDIAEIKFEKPVAIKPNIKYALRLRNHGGRTSNGDAGVSTVKGPDGTAFTFSSCSLSFNGTNPTRGQLPQLLYFNSPQENDIQSSTKTMAELYSRRTALSMTSTIVKTVSDLLIAARDAVDEKGLEVLNSAPVISKMMPHVFASIANLTKSDPHSAVQIISFIQNLLPSVAAMNNSYGLQVPSNEEQSSGISVPSPHYAWVESDHPYKMANVNNYTVSFPHSVQWMSIEFDPRCSTAQMEDVLQIYIKSSNSKANSNVITSGNMTKTSSVSSPVGNKNSFPSQNEYIPVLKRFSGSSNWPKKAVVLPGNEIVFSLETASDYVKDDKNSQFGFKCLVVGYDAIHQSDKGLRNLEMELSYLGGLCSAALMKKNLSLLSHDKEIDADDPDMIEDCARDAFEMHSTLLRRGFALDHPPSVQMALDENIPFSSSSTEMQFLRQFVNCSPASAGGRLARWLQPESCVDVEKCRVIFNDRGSLKCNWPTIITVVTRDQYGEVVHVPNMRVEVKAIPIDEANQALRKASAPDALTFGGHPPPNLDAKYEVTVKDKMFYHAITVHKNYENYSFEELRFASPTIRRKSENMLVRANSDGTYSANWTPGNVGSYKISVTVDGCDMNETFKVDVKDPPQGVVPPPVGAKKMCGADGIHRLRKFIAKPSAGLRVRIHPTLQSEQIGVIPVDGVVSIVDELHNSDGIWVRLGPETLAEVAARHNEGWCLQYNQHLEKTLMIPVSESKMPKLDENLIPSISHGASRTERPSFKTLKPQLPTSTPLNSRGVELSAAATPDLSRKHFIRGPGHYTVVKCGASGHNIRSKPSLAAAPIGMLSLGDVVNAIAVKEEPNGEVWIQLDQDTVDKHCFNTDVEDGWSLVIGATSIQYLESEAEVEDDKILVQQLIHQHQRTAVFTPPVRPYQPEVLESVTTENIHPIPKPRGEQSIGGIEMSASHEESFRNAPVQFDFKGDFVEKPTPPPRRSLERKASVSPGRTEFTQKPSSSFESRKPSFFSKFFKGEQGKRGLSSSPPLHRKSSSPPTLFHGPAANSDIPPELQGVSVKELVKVIGESRANGNGITPPGTPKSLRRSSRSASPNVGSRSLSSSPSPRASATQPHAVAASVAKSALSLSSESGDGPYTRQDSSQSDTSALISSITRDASQSPVTLNEVSVSSDASLKNTLKTASTFDSHSRESSAKKCKVELREKSKSRGSSFKDSSDFMLPQGEVKEAISPSVAESIRAVFAAFVWHEGIVHDAMTIASYLKFHPDLVKGKTTKAELVENIPPSKRREDLIKKQRHSVEVLSTFYLMQKTALSSDNSIEENANQSFHKSYHRKEAIPEENSSPETAETTIKDHSPLPSTLDLLVILWEEIKSYCSQAIAQQVILSSPLYPPGTKKSNMKKDKEKSKKSKRKPSEKLNVSESERQHFSAVWNSWSIAHENAKGPEKEAFYQMCEICGHYYQHPVTYHMRLAHPGCGKPSDGKGYSSGGNYCEGWAGNCGNGGVGGTSWYLICEKCRNEHMQTAAAANSAAEAAASVNSPVNAAHGRDIATSRRKPFSSTSSTMAKTSNQPSQQNSHLVMRNNAMFLLDLASASNSNLIPPSLRKPSSYFATSPPQGNEKNLGARRKNTSSLSIVSELSHMDPNPFPLVPFQCFNTLGIQPSQLQMINEELTLDQNGLKPDDALYRYRAPSTECSTDKISPPAQFKTMTVSFTDEDCYKEEKKGMNPKRFFGRSVSVGANPRNDWTADASNRIDSESPKEITRERVHETNSEEGSPSKTKSKRNSCFEMTNDSDLSSSSSTANSSTNFLSQPSTALQKLFSSRNVIADVLQRPVMGFVLQWNDLESLQIAMTLAIRKAACRTFSMQALNWLLRSVSQPACLHDLLWFFVSALETKNSDTDDHPPYSSGSVAKDEKGPMVTKDANRKHRKPQLSQAEASPSPVGDNVLKDTNESLQELCDHPTSDIEIGGEAINPLPETFHGLLQTISDLMLLLPVGSSLQQIAIRCWGIKFKSHDHQFLHQSHVFSTISRILSRSDDVDASQTGQVNDTCSTGGYVEHLTDLTSKVETKVSSRAAMLGSLIDNSTETFWESGDEDRNKIKWISLSFPSVVSDRYILRNICLHVDNGRDLGNKVSSVIFKAGKTIEENEIVKQVDIESRFAGWLSCFVPVSFSTPNCIKIELKGSDNTLRVRQVKILGVSKSEEDKDKVNRVSFEPHLIQQKNCEAETLRVFRLITGQVFGRLLDESQSEASELDPSESNLKEHVVGILFSRSKLTHLQKQVCSHIVHAIKRESAKFRDEWEVSLCSVSTEELPYPSDTYCFEMLSLVLALSGSTVGRTHLAQQGGLIQDLLTLLHTGTGRVQRQVISLLKRVLPKVSPKNFAKLLGIKSLPLKDFSLMTAMKNEENAFGSNHRILDVFLSCIAKSLTLQVKCKSTKGEGSGIGGKNITTVSLASSIHPKSNVGDRWWLRGTLSKKISEEIIQLVKCMTSGKFGEEWEAIAKSAIAENIIGLMSIDEAQREPNECLKLPILWLSLASLCVLDKDHVEGLSSCDKKSSSTPRATCENHDDGETVAIIICDVCGNLCGDCDRFLHLNRRTRSHQRQVFKEEEDAIKVDLHEGCGRIKLFWIMALADSLTLKAMIEFREGRRSASAIAGGPGFVGSSSHLISPTTSNPAGKPSDSVCRFCNRQSSADLPVMDSVCNEKECTEYSKLACNKILPCGHFCGGIANESECMPCLHGCSGAKLKQDADDMCMICFTEALWPVPSIQLKCGHVFHYSCCATVLQNKWLGPRITFGFRNCPICKTPIVHESLKHILDPIDTLYDDVKKKALMRLEYEGLSKCDALTSKGARFYQDPAGYALDRYAYYVCFKCGKAYYGGEAQCDADAGRNDDFNPEELVCGGCSDVSQAQMCPKHGTDYLEYKCRYCCSVAVFFCFGTTHFCNACHDDFQRLTNLPKQDLPQCPVGPKCAQLEGDECPLHVKHPPTGEEFALGCGVCRNAHTF